MLHAHSLLHFQSMWLHLHDYSEILAALWDVFGLQSILCMMFHLINVKYKKNIQ